MVKRVIAIAPGKIILHGEHAVVYGKKAIACAIDATITIELCATDDNCVSFHLPNVLCQKDALKIKIESLKELLVRCQSIGRIESNILDWHEKIKEFVASTLIFNGNENKLLNLALSSCLFAYMKILVLDGQCNFPSVFVKIESNNLPLGAGLGSSAACSVCLATTMLVHAGIIHPKENDQGITLDDNVLEKINETALMLEKLLHGNPSGIDNAISTYGGAVVYHNGKISHISSLPSLQFLVVNTGIARNTKSLVSSVKSKMTDFPEVVCNIMQAIHEISVQAEGILRDVEKSHSQNHEMDLKKLKELLKMNQHLLQSIGVSHPKIDEICKIAEENNFSCKLTGAGGGGCAIVMFDEATEQINSLINELNKRGFKNWKVKLGCKGVQLKQIAK
ncbi:unnamed protein product [Clavelina lepadiformis]|uniref:Mevalonate kinase n=1 Tax=Clavelina lepadiformis TaxID=159417 RepID=A0ABP0FPW4_CLALP